MNNLALNKKIAPGTWWLLALALMIVSGASGNIVTLFVLISLTISLVLIFREEAPWSKSLGFYLALALSVVVIRVGFRIIFNTQNPADQTIIPLPQLSLNLGFGPEVDLFGNVGAITLNAGLTDGLRLAAIILAVAMASSLANPRKLLKSTPGILYEVASAVSVAINLAPQLISSLQRVKKARELRGRSKGLSNLAGIIIPVLEDAIDSSIALAASMDARGFGRRGALSGKMLFLIRISSLSAIAFLAIGSFMLLAGGLVELALSLLGFGTIAIMLAIRLSSRTNIRTRFEPAKFSNLDYAVISLGGLLICLAIFGWIP